GLLAVELEKAVVPQQQVLAGGAHHVPGVLGEGGGLAGEAIHVLGQLALAGGLLLQGDDRVAHRQQQGDDGEDGGAGPLLQQCQSAEQGSGCHGGTSREFAAIVPKGTTVANRQQARP